LSSISIVILNNKRGIENLKLLTKEELEEIWDNECSALMNILRRY